MSSLPSEIYLNILVRVPTVKSLLRCKSVCKSWFSLISDPDFVRMHLNHTTQTNDSSIMIKTYDYGTDGCSFFSSSIESVVVPLDSPHSKPLERVQLCSSCDGLVYFVSYPMGSLFLWNPATKECKILPKSKAIYTVRQHRTFHGLGYDHKTDDYKLVEILQTLKTTLVQVYSLKSNSWKSFESIRYEFPCTLYEPSGAFVHGALHWKGSSTMIVSMDINEEKFKELQLPTSTGNDFVNIGVLGGCLCVLSNNKEAFEVWVMQDYGVPESWAKLCTIMYETIMDHPDHFVTLIGSFANGEFLIEYPMKGRLILYDPKHGTARKLNTRGLVVSRAVCYSESLVSLDSIAAVDEGTTKKSLAI